MSSTPPFIAQERPDTCALACLRMILSHRSTPVTEDRLLEMIVWQAGGLNPEELAQLAQRFGLKASEQQLERETIIGLVAQENFPIVFLHRRAIDGAEMVHAVIPIKFSEQFVTMLDPLRGPRRVSIRKFEEARRLVGNWSVVCHPFEKAHERR